MKYAVIITAAGSSSRMGGGKKKEYLPLEEGTVLSSSVCAFIQSGLASVILITVPPGGEREAREALGSPAKISGFRKAQPLPGTDGGAVPAIIFTEGGGTRQESVFKALSFLNKRYIPQRDFPGGVMIHDGARPWVTQEIIRAAAEGIQKYGAVTSAVPAVDTQKEIDETGKIIRHLERARVTAAQTPQGFRFAELLEAHRRAAADGCTYTDDTEIWGKYAGSVYICRGDIRNKKITYRDDIL